MGHFAYRHCGCKHRRLLDNRLLNLTAFLAPQNITVEQGYRVVAFLIHIDYSDGLPLVLTAVLDNGDDDQRDTYDDQGSDNIRCHYFISLPLVQPRTRSDNCFGEFLELVLFVQMV